MNEKEQWTWNDGWILMSVYLAQSEEGAVLTDIIGTADVTNHAIPTYNELSHSFAKLVNAGIIFRESHNFKISAQYSDGIEKAYKAKGGLFESANKGKKWLNDFHPEVIEGPEIIITREEVKDACDAYASKIKTNG